jgi:hypothetical protein
VYSCARVASTSAVFPLPLSDGVRWHETVFTPILRDDVVSGVAVVSRDVTARRYARRSDERTVGRADAGGCVASHYRCCVCAGI